MTRILIADDHEVVRSGLRVTLEAHEGWEVVAEASDGKEAIAKAVETRPDVAIIDFSLPGMNGIDATRQIHARVPTAEVLIFTMHDSDVLKRQALEAGARAYLLKSTPARYLISAVESLGPQRRYAGLMSPQRRPSDATSAYPEHQLPDDPSESEIRGTLEVVLGTEVFRTSPQLAAFLRFMSKRNYAANTLLSKAIRLPLKLSDVEKISTQARIRLCGLKQGGCDARSSGIITALAKVT